MLSSSYVLAEKGFLSTSDFPTFLLNHDLPAAADIEALGGLTLHPTALQVVETGVAAGGSDAADARGIVRTALFVIEPLRGEVCHLPEFLVAVLRADVLQRVLIDVGGLIEYEVALEGGHVALLPTVIVVAVASPLVALQAVGILGYALGAKEPLEGALEAPHGLAHRCIKHLRALLRLADDLDTLDTEVELALLHHDEIGLTGCERGELVGEDELPLLVVHLVQAVHGGLVIADHLVGQTEVVGQAYEPAPGAPRAVGQLLGREGAVEVDVDRLAAELVEDLLIVLALVQFDGAVGHVVKVVHVADAVVLCHGIVEYVAWLLVGDWLILRFHLCIDGALVAVVGAAEGDLAGVPGVAPLPLFAVHPAVAGV